MQILSSSAVCRQKHLLYSAYDLDTINAWLSLFLSPRLSSFQADCDFYFNRYRIYDAQGARTSLRARALLSKTMTVLFKTSMEISFALLFLFPLPLFLNTLSPVASRSRYRNRQYRTRCVVDVIIRGIRFRLCGQGIRETHRQLSEATTAAAEEKKNRTRSIDSFNCGSTTSVQHPFHPKRCPVVKSRGSRLFPSLFSRGSHGANSQRDVSARVRAKIIRACNSRARYHVRLAAVVAANADIRSGSLRVRTFTRDVDVTGEIASRKAVRFARARVYSLATTTTD